MPLTNKSQPPKSGRGIQSWHCFYWTWLASQFVINTENLSPGNPHTSMLTYIIPANCLNSRSRLGRGSVIDLVEILCQRRDLEGKGSRNIISTVSLGNRNLTLLSSFGKLTWDILGFCYEMLYILDILDDLVLEGAAIFWKWIRTWEFGAGTDHLRKQLLCLEGSIETIPHVWIHNSFSVIYRNQLGNRKYIKVNRFHKDQLDHRGVWKGPLLRSE